VLDRVGVRVLDAPVETDFVPNRVLEKSVGWVDAVRLAPKARNPPAECAASPNGGLRRFAPNPPYGLKQKLITVDGVASIESSFALEQVKYTNVLPIG
jgi:hypothetical protein